MLLKTPCVRAYYVLVSIRRDIGARRAVHTPTACSGFYPGAHDAVGRERIYVQLADLSGDSLELAAPYWDAALAEARKSGDLYGCKGRAGLAGTQIRRPGLAAGREIHRPCGQHSSETAPRPVPLVALRLLHLEADERSNNAVETIKRELDRLRDQNRATNSPPEERIEWEFLTGLSARLLVAGDRSLRQHRQGDPLCGAGIRKSSKAIRWKSVSTWSGSAANSLPNSTCSAKTNAPKSRSSNVSTCTAHGWRWTTASNAPTATRRATRCAPTRRCSICAKLSPKRRRPNITGSAWSWPAPRRSGRDLQHQRPLLPVHGGIRAGGVAYIDSAVTVYKRNGTKADFASIYAVQSWLYEHLGDYKNALEALRESNTIRHNDRVEEAQNSLAEMQTLFEVGQPGT